MSILAERYASPQMRAIWSREKKVLLERELWILIMKEQSRHGFPIPRSAVDSYEQVQSKIDLASIDKRESILKHDVKARIEEFNALAGYEYIHLGLTSRDVTDNVELYQLKQTLELVRFKSLALLARLGDKAESYAELPIVGRTHNVPAQVTTLGKRFSTWAEELLFSLGHLENFIHRLPLRGIKGALGTSSDQIELLGKSPKDIGLALMQEWGFDSQLASPSQIYPRSIDYEYVSTLSQLAAAPSNIAINVRLMSGHGLVSEGFAAGQVGSSAMPHKVNPRVSERINSLSAILKGFVTMANEISGEQWNEGDVSCSAIRRVVLPESAYVIDGILDSMISVLDGLQIDEAEIQAELNAHLPLMSTSRLLMLSVKKGVGREQAHRALKQYAQEWRNRHREEANDRFFEKVIQDVALKLDASDVETIIEVPLALAGDAPQQARKMSGRIREIPGLEVSRNYSPTMWS